MRTAHMNKNFEVTYDEIIKSQYACYGIRDLNLQIPQGLQMWWMGFPLIHKKDKVFVAFVRCEFCGQDDQKIENGRCGHCGGWIS